MVLPGRTRILAKSCLGLLEQVALPMPTSQNKIWIQSTIAIYELEQRVKFGCKLAWRRNCEMGETINAHLTRAIRSISHRMRSRLSLASVGAGMLHAPILMPINARNDSA
jgi:hypothetical protein